MEAIVVLSSGVALLLRGRRRPSDNVNLNLSARTIYIVWLNVTKLGR